MADMAVVVDNGTQTVRAGLAGEDGPRVLCPSVVGRLRYQTVNVGMVGGRDSYVGDEAQRKRGILSLRSPIERGLVTDWDDMERIWYHTFYHQLHVAPEEQPVLMTQALLNPNVNKDKMAQIVFEKFNFPALYMANQPTLCLYSTAHTTGLILSCGDGLTEIVPFYKGHTYPECNSTLDMAGHDLTDYLTKVLADRGHSFTSASYTREIVNAIKEKLCYVSLDFEQTMATESSSVRGDNIYQLPANTYQLPDGQVISLDQEEFRCPERLFKPDHGTNSTGIHNKVYNSINKCDAEIRKSLFKSIVLCGGTTTLHGFAERMRKEIERLVSAGTEVKVIASPDRKISAWIGGSIFASLSTFRQACASKSDYEEYGPAIIYEKCF